VRRAAFLLLVSVAASSAGAATYHLAVDVPTTIGAATYAPHQIVRCDDGVYTLAVDLPPDMSVLALDRAADGRWLVVPAEPASLGGAEVTPRDVVATDGSTFERVLDGNAAGIPPYARIDAVLREASGAWVLSFDVPVRLDGAEYGRSDLVRYDGTFRLAWNADAAGVPAYANTVGVGHDGAGFVVSFDVPTRLGSTDLLPGQLMRATAEALTAYASDPTWPASSQVRDFALADAAPAPPGAVPDGLRVAGVPLTASKPAPGFIALAWGPSCADGGTDYAVYQGTIGDWANPLPATCSTAGASTWSAGIPDGAVFFLVAARGEFAEGSYGTASSGTERPASPAACVPQVLAACR
jgi:hypothetical protein